MNSCNKKINNYIFTDIRLYLNFIKHSCLKKSLNNITIIRQFVVYNLNHIIIKMTDLHPC